MTKVVPGLGRYVQNHAVSPIPARGADAQELRFDSYACVWYINL
jgi:hypothetical protein